MATTRLRKAFRYPSDSDSDAPPDDMDEEEQETLITDLQTHDARTSTLYRRLLLPLPLLPLLLTLPSLLHARTALPAALAATSLALSAYVLARVPLGVLSEIHGKRANTMGAWGDGGPPGWVYAVLAPVEVDAVLGAVGRGVKGIGGAEAGLLEAWAAPLNAILSVVMALGAWVRQGGWKEAWLGWGPFVVFVFVLASRWMLRPVDVGQLQGLRYRYKGA